MKCPFCKVPCGNEHCAYNSECNEDECQKQLKGLQEENLRLKETIKEITNFIRGKD